MNIVDLADKLSRGDLIGATVSRVTILTDYTQPMVFSADDLKKLAAAKPDPNSPLKRYGKLLQPTIIIESPAVDRPVVIAPYGRADATAWKANQSSLKWKLLGTAALLFGGAFLLGRVSKR